jgi:hypothetical protein
MSSGKDLIVSLDVEATGDNIAENELVSLGYCIGDFNGKIYEKGRVSLKFDEKKMEQRCYDEYWSKHLDQLEVFKKEATDPKLAMDKFVSVLESYEVCNNLYILTDNPAYDIAYTNIYLKRHTKRRNLQYQNDKYRGVYDILELALERSPESFTYDKNKLKQANNKISVKHDHWPENDAEYNYRKTLAMINEFSSISMSAKIFGFVKRCVCRKNKLE